MALTHNLGFPRIGAKRELKFALEDYWKGQIEEAELKSTAKAIRKHHWGLQVQSDWVPVGDFSLYDQVLDTSFLLGNIPKRFQGNSGSDLDTYFRVARGASSHGDGKCSHAGEMTKWFDTNYHYIVPEVSSNTAFKLNPTQLLDQLAEAQALNLNCKPVIIGPLTYLWLSKVSDNSDRLALLTEIISVYQQLLDLLATRKIEWIQLDEPILVTELDSGWRAAFESAYHTFSHANIKILLTTYFGALQDNLQLACKLPVAGLHLDAIGAKNEVESVADWLPSNKILSLGVVNGRNIWKTDLNATLSWLQPLAERLGDRLWLAPSCSLMHVPVSLQAESQLDTELKSWLAFAQEKLEELDILKKALNLGIPAVQNELNANRRAILSRQQSASVVNPVVSKRIAAINRHLGNRRNSFAERSAKQKDILGLPVFPTTTIGSFPQTADIRLTRRQFKKGEIGAEEYRKRMQEEIRNVIRQQESLGLDVLVHGEPERNDMVEYFAEHLAGFTTTQAGWVQSYGSRCVKPPILYGDVYRDRPITVDWIVYAQSLTSKPVKGMLTGPVTILNWSFVRDDQPPEQTCKQIALAVHDEVQALEQAGIKIIQIDEAALREGLPLRKAEWRSYLDWAVEAFRISANGVQDSTQIHTHMCYSEFNDIIDAIAALDADVITIETARSAMELLKAFEQFEYPNEIGPGVYDIHSPNLPTEAQISELIEIAAKHIPTNRLWINPDCGLKTRKWNEVVPALRTMVEAAKKLRETKEFQES